MGAAEQSRLLVLIVDDYPIARRMFVTGLLQYGVDSIEAGDADEAIALAAAHQPDVAVVDLFLGSSSGLDVARALRSDPRHAGIAIIALSGHAAQEHRDAAAEAGCDAYLVKPCVTDQLVETIERVLSAKIAAA